MLTTPESREETVIREGVFVTKSVYELFTWPGVDGIFGNADDEKTELLTSVQEGDSSYNLTTAYTYWTDTNDSLSYLKTKSVSNPDGSWTKYFYELGCSVGCAGWKAAGVGDKPAEISLRSGL